MLARTARAAGHVDGPPAAHTGASPGAPLRTVMMCSVRLYGQWEPLGSWGVERTRSARCGKKRPTIVRSSQPKNARSVRDQIFRSNLGRGGLSCQPSDASSPRGRPPNADPPQGLLASPRSRSCATCRTSQHGTDRRRERQTARRYEAGGPFRLEIPGGKGQGGVSNVPIGHRPDQLRETTTLGVLPVTQIRPNPAARPAGLS